MKRLPLRLQTNRGDAFTLDFSVSNDKGDPFVVPMGDNNPYLACIVTSARYKQEGDFKQIYWLNLGEFPTFRNTLPLYLPSFPTSAVVTFVSSYYATIDTSAKVQQYLFYSIINGKRVYKYYTEIIDNNYAWVDYDFHILQTFQTDKWVEQTYILQIKYLTGVLNSEPTGPALSEITQERTILDSTFIDVASNLLREEAE